MRYTPHAVLFVAIAVMASWYLRLDPVLTFWSKERVPMQFNTALCFALLASAVLKPPFVKASLVACFSVAALTVCQYATGFNFGIDQLFCSSHIDTMTSHPGRMDPNTSICFMLLCFSVFGRAKGESPDRYRNRGAALSAVVLIFSVLPVMGYCSGDDSLFRWREMTGMALHTAILFLGLAVFSYRNFLKEPDEPRITG